MHIHRASCQHNYATTDEVFTVEELQQLPIEFDSIDEQPVDLIFLLLAPECAGADHLKALARVSRLLRDRITCEKLRGSDDPAALYVLLIETPADAAA